MSTHPNIPISIYGPHPRCDVCGELIVRATCEVCHGSGRRGTLGRIYECPDCNGRGETQEWMLKEGHE